MKTYYYNFGIPSIKSTEDSGYNDTFSCFIH